MNFLSGYKHNISGHVAPGFEPVKKELEEYFRNGMESRAQLCVYIGEEKVIGKFLLAGHLIKHSYFNKQIFMAQSTTMMTSDHQI